MILALTIMFFVLGLIIGSFLNVVICRLHTHRTFGGRSICMSCSKVLSWYELVPVLSYVCLRGRCSQCKSRISFQYIAVEILTGAIFALLFVKFQNVFFVDTLSFSTSYAFFAVIFCLLLVILVHDMRHKIIPDALSLVFGIFAFIGIFLFDGYLFSPHIPEMADFLAGFIVSVPFALIWFVSRGRWMGLGDAKLAVGLGFLLGFWGMISATIIAFWAGAIVGIAVLAFSRKYGLKSELPFAPFLVIGAVLVFLFDISIFLF